MSEKERQYVAGMYKNSGWRRKVAKMSDAQVIAIYLKEQSKPKPEDKPPDPPEDPQIPF